MGARAVIVGVLVTAAAGGAGLVITAGGGGGVTCNATISSGSVSTALAARTAGETLCLSPGSSYTFTTGAISKASMTTVTSATGVASDVTIPVEVNVQTSNNLKFQALTIAGFESGTSSGTATNLQLVDITFTDGVCLNIASANSARAILVDQSRFTNIGQNCNEGRLSINGRGTTQNNGFNQGIVISNSLFSGSGSDRFNCSDGIHLTGDASGVTITNNQFLRIKQHPNAYGYQSFDCDNGTVGDETDDAHVDPIQAVDAEYTTLTGNFFYQNSTGLLASDCTPGPYNATQNVWTTDGEYPDQAFFSGAITGSTFSHNVLAGGAGFRTLGNTCNTFTGTVTNNVITGGLTGNTPTGTIDYNLTSTAALRGANGINGSPTYVAGGSPTTWAGFELASSSLGYHAAADSSSLGINP